MSQWLTVNDPKTANDDHGDDNDSSIKCPLVELRMVR